MVAACTEELGLRRSHCYDSVTTLRKLLYRQAYVVEPYHIALGTEAEFPAWTMGRTFLQMINGTVD